MLFHSQAVAFNGASIGSVLCSLLPCSIPVFKWVLDLNNTKSTRAALDQAIGAGPKVGAVWWDMEACLQNRDIRMELDVALFVDIPCSFFSSKSIACRVGAEVAI